MRKALFAAAFVACTLAAPAHAGPDVWLGFPVDFRHAPTAPRIVITSEPRVEVVREVAVVEDPRCDDDMFRYHDSWYVMRNRYWYRSASWRGPWLAVDVHRVPREIIEVPRAKWKHHPLGGPPGQLKKMRREEMREQGDDDDRGHGHGKGHGKGHGGDSDR